MNSLLSFANLMRPEDIGRFALLLRRTGGLVEGCGASWRPLPAGALFSIMGHERRFYRVASKDSGVGLDPLMNAP